MSRTPRTDPHERADALGADRHRGGVEARAAAAADERGEARTG